MPNHFKIRGIEIRSKMVHTQLVNAIIDGLLSATLPKQPGKPSYGSIRDTHHLLTANAEKRKNSGSS